VTDRIRLAIAAPEDIRTSLERMREYVMEETLAVELQLSPALESTGDLQSDDTSVEIDGTIVHIHLTPAV